jgi:hypothetical protein
MGKIEEWVALCWLPRLKSGGAGEKRGAKRMRVFGLAVVVVTISGAIAIAADTRFERTLKMLAPEERLEQLCDYTAMTRIRNEAKQYRPDRAVANATAEPKASGDTLEVTGGAFRSRKQWYALSYRCTATPDHMTVVAFRFTIGEPIPEAKWTSYGLWD